MSMSQILLLIAAGVFFAFLVLRLLRARRAAPKRGDREPDGRITAETDRLAAEEATRRETERLEAEEAVRREAERLAAEEAAHREAERLAAEEAARHAAERLAAEEAARHEAERLAAEEAARRETERLAAEEAVRREVERLAAEEAARREAERLVAEEAARREAERLAAEEAVRRETERLEAERLAAEEAARREADRLAVEEALRQEEEERLAVEAAIAQESERQAAEEALRRTLAAAHPPAKLKAKTEEETVVMVADDSRVVRIKTGRLLAAHRYQVVMAEDGLDAARQIEAAAPDVLVTDVDMPGINGLQLARQVRGNPLTASVPIIMVTSDNEQLRAEAAAAGVDVLLGKPYPEEQLISHIKQLMIAQAGS